MKRPFVDAARCAALVLGVLLLPASSPAMAAAADGAAVVTILDGDAIMFRGTSKLAAARGVLVKPDDLFESSTSTFARLEFDDGTSIDLGPSTRLQVSHPTGARGDRPALYLLSGWIKVSLGNSKQVPSSGFASLQLDGVEMTGNIVVRSEGGTSSLFVEQGRVRCKFHVDHDPQTFGTGDFVSISGEGAVAVDVRPSDDFLARLPIQFRDTIRSQKTLRALEPRALGSFSYTEVEAWLDAEPSIRRQFVSTWRDKADEPEFRLALTAKIDQHPEWGPVLFPALFPGKPASGSVAVDPPQVAPVAPPSAVPDVRGPVPGKSDSGVM